MAMIIRLTGEETALLRRQAEREGRLVDEVVRLAIRARIVSYDRTERVRALARRVASDHAEILDRLKDS